MLAPGTYRLASDLANPQADRRERYDWRKKAVTRELFERLWQAYTDITDDQATAIRLVERP